MRGAPAIAIGLFLSAASCATLPGSPTAPGAGETRTALTNSLRVKLVGQVQAPTGFTAAARLIGSDGASLVGSDGASLIGHDGAGLAHRTVQATAGNPLGGCLVAAASAAGKVLANVTPVRADAQGRYVLEIPAGANVQILAGATNAAGKAVVLRTLARADSEKSGTSTGDVDAATTCMTVALLDRKNATTAIPLADFVVGASAVRAALAKRSLPDLADVAAVNKLVEAVATEGTDDAEPSPAASTPAATPPASPTATPVVTATSVPVAPPSQAPKPATPKPATPKPVTPKRATPAPVATKKPSGWITFLERLF